ncbi:MAG TPA: hypothetical protein VEQ63_01520 [Bryobacteraceae bacterium]|nr:hypothetical protein [Bryobacteraceae bacterium]
MSAAADVGDRFRSFVSSLPQGSRVAVVGHSDVDGLAATTITCRAFEHSGHTVWPYVTKKGENAWSQTVLDQVLAAGVNALAIVDLGSRADPLLPKIPSVLVDHHKPTGVPDGAVLITGYGLEPTPSSGLLTLWCAQSLGAADGLEWLAAASMMADYGDANAFPETRKGAKAVGLANLRRITTLLNSPRRTATGDANPALRMLLSAANASELLQGTNEETLLAAKAEVDSALQRARRSAPRFAGNVALILVDEGCQVHPLVAQTWRTRLRKNIVICANTGYLAGRVNFSVRTATSENLLDFLQRHRPPNAGEDYGRGHDKATGGSLAGRDWQQFLASLGFPEG